MVLGLVLAVAAMGFAVAMPLAVQSFTRLTSDHQGTRVAETDPTPVPLVTPDTAAPKSIILPGGNRTPADAEEPQREEKERRAAGSDPSVDGQRQKEAHEPKEKGPKKNNSVGQGEGREKGDRGPKDKDPKPESPAEPREPQDEDKDESDDDDSPGKSGEHRDDDSDEDDSPAPGSEDDEDADSDAEDDDDDDESKGKGKGKGRALGLTSAPGNSGTAGPKND
jgi:hypothetical protein